MKVTAFTRLAVGLGTTAVAVGALALPAQADPAPGTFGTLVGLGSDTTQDVVGAIAASSGGLLASYDATGGASVVTRAGGNAIPRANGSGAGRDLLRVAIGQTPNANVATLAEGAKAVVTADVVGTVDFARSSSGPSTADVTADGVLTYIPFATDAVTYAVAPGSAIPTDLTTLQLTAIYKGQYDRVASLPGGGSQLLGPADAVPLGATVTKITTFVPQAGSGTRSYWLGKVGITENDIAGGTYPNITATDFAGHPVQEHHGQALVSGTDAQDRGAIVPFSAGQWVAQGNGKVADNRAGAVLGATNAVAPVTGAAGAYALNPAYNAYTRLVYNIVPSRLADDPSSTVAKAFVGPTSFVCSQTATIAAYGFGPLTGSTACGDTTTRAYAPAASSSVLTLAAPGSVTVGTAATLRATVTNVGDGGGTVTFAAADGTSLGTTTVPAGASVDAKVAYTPRTVGTLPVVAYFVPALTGVDAPPVTAPQNLTVTAVPAVGSTTKVAASSRPVVGKTVTFTATVTAKAYAPGTVTFYDGSRKLGAVAFSTTRHTAALTLKATRTSYAVKAVYTPRTSAVVRGSTSTTVKVAVAKATAKVTATKPASVRHGKRSSTTVKVTATGVVPSGTVRVLEGKKVVATARLSSKGGAKITLPALKKGTHRLTVVYAGSSLVKPATSARVTLVVR